MRVSPELIKNTLDACIRSVVKASRLFVRNPMKDFTRNRKLSLTKVIEILLSMGGNSISKELLDYFNYDANVATASAFVQQRNKLLSEALGFLLLEFSGSINNVKTYENFRLLSVDGTGASIPSNPQHPGTYVQNTADSKGHNILHINAMYDLCNRIYTDVDVQVIRKKNEFRAMTNMVDRSNIEGKVIVIADRGYESYNIVAHMENKKWNYLIRVKEPNSKKGFLSTIDLPINEEFDREVEFKLTRRQTKEVLTNKDKYRLLVKSSTFDYLEQGSKETYPISYRAVCIEIETGKYQYFITNLNSVTFPKEKIKELYHMRWGIETSFRELKYALGLTSFHSKKVDLIKQEIYAKMVMYNFCEMITSNVIVTQKPRKHTYQVNFTMAIHICKQYFLRFNDVDPPDVEALILRYILPVRENRKYPRKVKIRSCISFLYRVA